MRKRWHVPDGFLPLLFGTWILGWIPPCLIIGALTTPCDSQGHCGMNSDAPGLHAYGIFMIVWFGVVLIPAACVGLALLGSSLWALRPRRVVESVEDIREAYRDR